MKRTIFIFVVTTGSVFGTVINTNSAGAVTTFQTGATVNNFSTVTGVTAQALTAYSEVAVNSNARVFNQIAGVQFSVGGVVGTDRPAVFSLGGAIAGDARSATNVLGTVDFDNTTNFVAGSFLEIFFPTKVDRVGFWVNPTLGNVTFIAADTNFAFSGLNETNLENGAGTAGNFVGIQRATADIGGFKIFGVAGGRGFTIDDFTFKVGTSNPVPEPTSLVLVGTALAILARVRVKK